MDRLRVALLGMGSTRCAAPIVGSLATYFGERPLQLAFYDADHERLELYTRLAQVCFPIHDAAHAVASTTDPEEALDGASRVVLAVGANCALRCLGIRRAGKDGPTCDSLRGRALEQILATLRPDSSVLSLLPATVPVPLAQYFRLEWPGPVELDDRRTWPHQVLRWVRQDDYIHQYVMALDRSPLKAWLDDVETAIPVCGGRRPRRG